MYNKYTYDFSKPMNMNINANIKDCFEEVKDKVDINKILDDINSKFIADQEEKEEPVINRFRKYKEPVTDRYSNRFSKYKRI